MSSSSDDVTATLRYEYETLSQQASSLAVALARRRADVALMRAEAATKAVSLESAKELLNDLLRKEAVIRTKAPPSPILNAGSEKEKFAPDPGVVRSLAGQLEVTRLTVNTALQRKASMQSEIDRLAKLTLETGKDGEDALGDGQKGAELGGSFVPGLRLEVVREEDGDIAGGGLLSEADITLSQKKRKARHSGEVSMLRVLKEGTESNSSFRFDHARIWRDVTMPNLALIPLNGNSAVSELLLGVVIERIFEGVTCFTPTASAKQGRSSAADLRIESSDAVQPASEQVTKLVFKHFGSLTVGAREDSKKVRIVAPKVALDRIMDLISDEDNDISTRLRPQLPVTGGEDAATEDHKADDDGVRSAAEVGRSPRRHRTPELSSMSTVAVKLSNPSHVLHLDQISQIMGYGVPIRFHESALRLIYSTNEHGMSLHTLYTRVKTTSPTLLAIRDTKDRVFGCYAAAPWKSSSTRYYGTGESFVFGTDGPNIAKVYKWSRANSFFQFTSHSFLAIGGGAGSHFALWIDEDLLMGTTSACSTFASPPLTDPSDKDASSCMEFKIVSLEVWGFDAHMNHH